YLVPLFQACCLNFERTICEQFGETTSLSKNLSLALQFAKLELEQISELQQYEVPDKIQALQREFTKNIPKEVLQDAEYQLKVKFNLETATKANAHFEFFGDKELDELNENAKTQIVFEKKFADNVYPHKPRKVCELVTKQTGRTYNMHQHIQAWKRHKVRPDSGSKRRDKTDPDYCIYHKAHKDYTYSDKWVELLVSEFEDSLKQVES
ncbi:MAG: DUF3644 domain-containing protein, partial [Hyphomicrobiales bacterium]